MSSRAELISFGHGLPMRLIKDAVLRGAQEPHEKCLEIEAENFTRAFFEPDWNK